MRRRTRNLVLALAGVVLAADQALQHTALADGVLLGRFIAPFDPPVFTRAQRDHVASLGRRSEPSSFDGELGWSPTPGSTWLEARFDALGSRAGARTYAPRPAAGMRRVVAVGCSFTMGMEVGDAQTWPALVEAGKPELEVLNLAVAGYGLDQAYLRYLRDGRALGADEVWIGLMPEAALRVSTLYVPLCQRWAPTCAFKPRFAPDATRPGGLRLVPNPAHDFAENVRLLTDQAAFVDALEREDLWVRRAPAAFAPRGTSPLHWFASTRLALTAYERSGLDPAAWLRDPDSEVYRVLLGVLLALRDACGEDGARPRVAILPSGPDLRGDVYWDGLVADLRSSDVDCVDVTPALRAAGGAEEPGLWMPKGHYSPAANAIVADALWAAWR